MNKIRGMGAVAAVCMLTVFISCSPQPSHTTAPNKKHDDKQNSHHHHRTEIAPAYGGKVVPIGHSHGDDGDIVNYFAELVREDSRLLMYVRSENDGDEQDVQVAAEKFDGFVARKRSSGSETLSFEPKQAGEGDTSSCFVCELPDRLARFENLIVIPSLRVSGTRMRFSFSIPDSDATDSDGQGNDDPGKDDNE